MKNNVKLIKVSILGSILTLAIYLSFKLPSEEAAEIISNNYKAVGVITNVGYKTVVISYSVNDKVYQYTRNKPYSGLIEGEEFYTLVSTKDLNRALVFFEKPIIDSIKYKYALTSKFNANKLWIDDSEISFSYKVADKEYSRIQKYEAGKRPDDFKKIVVKYRVDRPEVGYLIEVSK